MRILIIFEIAVMLKLHDLILIYPFYILNFEKAESWFDGLIFFDLTC